MTRDDDPTRNCPSVTDDGAYRGSAALPAILQQHGAHADENATNRSAYPSPPSRLQPAVTKQAHSADYPPEHAPRQSRANRPEKAAERRHGVNQLAAGPHRSA